MLETWSIQLHFYLSGVLWSGELENGMDKLVCVLMLLLLMPNYNIELLVIDCLIIPSLIDMINLLQQP